MQSGRCTSVTDLGTDSLSQESSEGSGIDGSISEDIRSLFVQFDTLLSIAQQIINEYVPTDKYFFRSFCETADTMELIKARWPSYDSEDIAILHRQVSRSRALLLARHAKHGERSEDSCNESKEIDKQTSKVSSSGSFCNDHAAAQAAHAFLGA